MEKVTIKAYAVKHKLSIFNVMKMAKSGKLKSEEIEERGKRTIYIVVDEELEKKVVKDMRSFSEIGTKKMTLEEEVKVLKNEVQALRLELEILKSKI